MSEEYQILGCGNYACESELVMFESELVDSGRVVSRGGWSTKVRHLENGDVFFEYFCPRCKGGEG